MVANLHIPGPVLTVKQYLAMERNGLDKHEYIDGHVYAMAGGTRRHAAISANVIAALASRLAGGPCQVYTSDVRIQLTPARYVYPDASVSCDARDRLGDDDEDEDDRIHYPRVVVEVLSPSTEPFDRHEKFALYRDRETLQDYVLVATREMEVEVYHRGHDDSWGRTVYGPGDTVSLESIGAGIPIAAFYMGITFVL
jgi:Uma2 family endonuclease